MVSGPRGRWRRTAPWGSAWPYTWHGRCSRVSQSDDYGAVPCSRRLELPGRAYPARARGIRRRRVRNALMVMVTLSAMLTASAGRAEVAVNINIGPPPPIVVSAPPQLVVVPAVPAVRYAPSLNVDVFFYSGHYYYW